MAARDRQAKDGRAGPKFPTKNPLLPSSTQVELRPSQGGKQLALNCREQLAWGPTA